MREFLLGLLKELETRIPPPEKVHHCITYAQYGSDETGWEDRLALQVNDHGKLLCFFLEDADFDKKISVLVEEIADSVENEPDGQTQFGVGPAQYSK